MLKWYPRTEWQELLTKKQTNNIFLFFPGTYVEYISKPLLQLCEFYLCSEHAHDGSCSGFVHTNSLTCSLIFSPFLLGWMKKIFKMALSTISEIWRNIIVLDPWITPWRRVSLLSLPVPYLWQKQKMDSLLYVSHYALFWFNPHRITLM